VRPERPVCPDKTRHDLEWDRITSALSERCRGPHGARLAAHLPFPETLQGSRIAHEQAREALALADAADELPLDVYPDVAEAVGRARAQGVLGPAELVAILKFLGTCRVLRKFLAARREKAPRLFETCSTDPTLDRLHDTLQEAFDADGSLSDRASPKLREVRGEYQAARSRILSRLDDVMKRYEPVMQDRFVTEREGRYVLPVRSDAHERFPGIVHGSSASGSTLFVEPRVIVGMGNRLKMLEAEITREEVRVLTQLSSTVGASLPSLEGAVEAVALADVRAATARLAIEFRLIFPNLVDRPELDLRDARHPLLLLEKVAVVPSDLRVSQGRAMIISGPNAGGKTVALKMLGLAALMARAGLPVSCGEDSTVGLFESVLTDVGDDQSLSKSLSTFSAHVENLTHILEDTTAGVLVLLDELAGGTDPREGEALAAGVLDSLVARQGTVAVTTHYEGLKVLASADDRFANASVGFDFTAMAPTFKVTMGIPGSSSALAVAERFGMPKTVLERARSFLSQEDRDYASSVADMDRKMRALDLAKAATDAEATRNREVREELERELTELRARERAYLSHQGETVLAELRRLQSDLREAKGKIKTAKADPAGVAQASKILDRAAADFALGGRHERLVQTVEDTPSGTIDAGRLKRGDRVYLTRLRMHGDVIELLADGNVRIAAGPLKLMAHVSDLTPPKDSDYLAGAKSSGKMKAKRAIAAVTEATAEPAIQTSDNTCDLRGLTVDDGIAMAMTFLDRAMTDGRRTVFLLHGHGTGALRDAIRKELKTSTYVQRFRPGQDQEGGNGVTVVWLA
jgi:DNA mismatch repair protein MutS2